MGRTRSLSFGEQKLLSSRLSMVPLSMGKQHISKALLSATKSTSSSWLQPHIQGCLPAVHTGSRCWDLLYSGLDIQATVVHMWVDNGENP